MKTFGVPKNQQADIPTTYSIIIVDLILRCDFDANIDAAVDRVIILLMEISASD